MRRLKFVWNALRQALGWSPALTAAGLLGIALGALCLGVAFVGGTEIPPEGNLIDTASFDGAVGIFYLTLTALASGVRWQPRGRRLWVGALVGFVLYAYGIETVQAFRGLDPRFSRVAGDADKVAGGLFFLDAVAIMVCFLILAVKYVRAASTPRVIAVRYGAATSLIAFGVGIWMSLVTTGRYVPEAGNLLVLHAAGFHGLQAIPVVALLLHWADQPERMARRYVHLAGLAWLGACLAIAWHSGSGRAIQQLAPASGLAAAFLAGWLVVGAAALRRWLVAAGPIAGREARA